MSTKNLFSNLKNNHRLIIIVILLIVLVVLAHRYQRESFQEVNINSLAKAGSVGSAGPPGEDGADGVDGVDGDNALKVLQKLEAPPASSADELSLYKGIFAEGSNDTAEGDSAIQILKGLVDHITAKVTRNVGLGVPVHAVIPFHINKDDEGMTAAYTAYVAENSGVVVGGVNDSLEILPFGFQVCNGAALQKIVTLANGDIDKTADDSGRNTPDYRGRFIIGGGHCASNENAGRHADGDDTLYPNDYFYDQTHKGGVWKHQLSKAEMPKHTHNINMNLVWDWSDNPADAVPQRDWRTAEKGWPQAFEGEFTNEGPNFGGAGYPGTNLNLDGNPANLGRILLIDHEGDTQAHNNMPPYAVVLYLIKVKDES